MRSRLRNTVPVSRAPSSYISFNATRPSTPSRFPDVPSDPRGSASCSISHSYPHSRSIATASPAVLPHPQRSLVACPYQVGSELTLQFTPEASVASFPLRVRVIKAFTPYTVSQTLVVESHHHSLPRQFTIKFADPRFSAPDLHAKGYQSPWSTTHDADFDIGLRNVKNGSIPNFWKRLGGVQQPWTKRPFVEDDDLREGWIQEMDHWDGVFDVFHRELQTYRVLRPLQGADIPMVYGVCTLAIAGAQPGSLIERVNGICMEYIDGTSMDRLHIGVEISEADALRVSPRILDALRRIRQLRVLHRDIAARNIILRRDTLSPVWIDFGSAATQPPEETRESWTQIVGEVNEVGLARRILWRAGWHNPSPPLTALQTCLPDYGYGLVNHTIEEVRPDWRAEHYEPIEDISPETLPSGRPPRWKPLKWRVKEGVKMDTDDLWRG
ncbi:hypothetical protein BV25DRAFT_1821252 [Artomyces pyxidatus]|uniref:Uncharacterized protein n=1 Tax=Artomyces pyxidatus TaxID=48021 RepID=A0ACB8TCI1_9AGAM|nr:hypothetical protein BV25DRAFT_1821252 [Artomyces pyxidatus]